MKGSAKIVVFLAIVAGLITAVFFALGKYSLTRLETEKAKITQDIQQKIVLDDLENEAASAPDNPQNDTSAQQTEPPSNIPAKKLLAMPFYSQAPNGNWDAVHEEMCEEASLLNAGLYLQGKKLSAADYDRELLKLKDLGDETVGTWVSTTIADTKKLSDAYFGQSLKSKIIDNPTIAEIEAEVAADHPVIVPLAGREVGNPNYTPPGPIYHMLVVKGYDEKFFITNDVGTRKGDSYVFTKKIIMDKMHDWNEKDIHLGVKKILVLYK